MRTIFKNYFPKFNSIAELLVQKQIKEDEHQSLGARSMCTLKNKSLKTQAFYVKDNGKKLMGEKAKKKMEENRTLQEDGGFSKVEM